MKSIKLFAMAGAIALLGAAGFTSCTEKNKPETPVTPGNYNGEIVKTEFAINIPLANTDNSIRRMPGKNIPQPGRFLGMDSIVIMSFVTAETGTPGSAVDPLKSAAIVGGNKRLGNNLILGTGTNYVQASGLTANGNTKVFEDVDIPIGTNHFLFYGHSAGPISGSAPVLQGSYTPEQSFQYGRLTDNSSLTNEDPSSIQFSLVQIYTPAGTTPKGDLLATYLTHIAEAKDATANWAAGGASASSGMIALRDSLLQLTAGSSASIVGVLTDLYQTLRKQPTTGPTKDLTKAILDSIQSFYDGSSHLFIDTFTTTNGKGQIILPTQLAGYPANLNLPDGAAVVEWNAGESKFKVVNSSATTWAGLPIPKNTAYVYPACVYYYANSGLKTSKSKQSNNYGTKYWGTILSTLYNEDGGKNIKVSNTTRSVAIADSVQYAVAQLITQVKANNTTLADKAGTNITITDGKIQVTGILVANQGPVRFDFTPASVGNQIIYDREISPYNLSTAFNETTAIDTTLVLETPASQDVKIAVEFLNNAEDFVGVQNRVIPKGSKFYVVATLPYSASTETGIENQVFKQDFLTKAQLNLTSLANAYNVVPDLRTQQLELGFSVDLAWRSGHVYTVNF